MSQSFDQIAKGVLLDSERRRTIRKVRFLTRVARYTNVNSKRKETEALDMNHCEIRQKGQTSESILNFIAHFTDINGYSPSVREIAAGVGLKSSATVAGHLERLRDAGKIDGHRHKARALRVVQSA